MARTYWETQAKLARQRLKFGLQCSIPIVFTSNSRLKQMTQATGTARSSSASIELPGLQRPGCALDINSVLNAHLVSYGRGLPRFYLPQGNSLHRIVVACSRYD